MTAAGRLGWVTDRRGISLCRPASVGRGLAADPRAVLALWHRVTGLTRAPDCCLVNFYGEGARMGLHQDRDEGDFSFPVVSISLGDEALFRMGGVERQRADDERLAALGRCGGDGGRGAAGLARDRPGAAWQLALLPKGGRINLTLRVVAA